MPDSVIRPATIDDVEGIAAVHVGSWRETYAGLLPDMVIAARSLDVRIRQWTSRLADPVGPSGVHVAEVDGRIVGFCSENGARPEIAPFADREIGAIYLLRAFQGNGIGRLLMDAALDAARCAGGQMIGLWVLEGNDTAIRFYEKAAFRQVTTRIDTIGTVTFNDLGYVRGLG